MRARARERSRPRGEKGEGLVRIEARTGREDSGLTQRRRRDNGSNELTRTPEPRLSLSSRSSPPSPPRSSTDHRARSVSLAPFLPSPPFFPPPPVLPLRVSHSFSSFCTTTIVESNPICHLCSFSSRLPVLSFSVSLSRARLENACARTRISRSRSFSLSFSLASGPV